MFLTKIVSQKSNKGIGVFAVKKKILLYAGTHNVSCVVSFESLTAQCFPEGFIRFLICLFFLRLPFEDLLAHSPPHEILKP